MNGVRMISAIVMLGGLLYGAVECSRIHDRAETIMQQIFAMITAVAYFTFAYILARAIENIGFYIQARRRQEPQEPRGRRGPRP
jgi:hypothetical protein